MTVEMTKKEIETLKRGLEQIAYMRTNNKQSIAYQALNYIEYLENEIEDLGYELMDANERD